MADVDDLVALLRRCHLEPEALAPRLVVADWLEENVITDAEAALAGVLRRARRDSFVYADPVPRIEEEDKPAVRAHAPAWLGRLASRSWGFEHGLFSFRCEASELIGRSLPRPPLPGGVAWVARLKVDRIGPGTLPGVLSSPWLDGFHGVLALNREQDSDDDIVEAFASQPRLRSLTGLILSYRPLGAAFAGLCERVTWGEVVTLGLGHAGLSSRDIGALAASPLARGLRLFKADYNRIGSPGIIALCRACPGLFALHVDHNRVTDTGVRAIAGLRSLRWLNLFGNAGITLKGARALLESRLAATLNYLCLPDLGVGDGLCRALVAAPFTALTRLDVSGESKMTPAGLQTLIDAPCLRKVTWMGVPRQAKILSAIQGREGLHLQ